MAEAAFAKTFLSSLDGRPIKLSPDHVQDPRQYPARPAYILPRMPQEMSKPSSGSNAPGQEPSITVTIKSLRNPPLDIKLSSQPATTSVHDIKAQVSAQTRIPVEKMKLLLSKRPVLDSKILRELTDDKGGVVDFSVMVMGGAAAIPPPPVEAMEEDTATENAVGEEALASDGFWADLEGFLSQRLKDQGQAEKLSALFRTSWSSSQAKP